MSTLASEDKIQGALSPAGLVQPEKESAYFGRRGGVSRWVLSKLSRETSSGRFIPEMDGLRFIAIGMVVLFHLNAYLMAKSALFHVASAAQSDWLARIALVGFHGVELFFVISGFILALPFAAHHINGANRVKLHKYYVRRLTRLEPPYFVTVFVLFALAISVQGETAVALLPHLGASLVYLHSVIYGTHSPVIGVAWSLEIEVQFYLLVPLLTLLFAIRNRRMRRLSLIALIIVILAVQPVLLGHSARLHASILAYLQFFLIGFLLADVFLTDWKSAPRQSFYWDLIALVGWPLLFISLRSDNLTHWLFPCMAFFMYLAAFRGSVTNRFFSNRWITVIGGMCYSIYLIHYEVISALGRFTRRIGTGFPYWTYLLVQLLLVGTSILVICGGYFLILEKPCMRRDWPERLWKFALSLFENKRTATTTATG